MDSLDGKSNDGFDFTTGTAEQTLNLQGIHYDIFVDLAKESNLVTFNSYQAMAGKTAGTPVECSVIGLCGEAGEVAELYKKAIYHGHKMDREKLVKELGDVLWYLSDLASKAGITLQEVANKNIQKLMKRYPDGFSQKASVERTDQ
jgi:NTP pyrophosphatase (non-canonical NTP hydrolase)